MGIGKGINDGVLYEGIKRLTKNCNDVQVKSEGLHKDILMKYLATIDPSVVIVLRYGCSTLKLYGTREDNVSHKRMSNNIIQAKNINDNRKICIRIITYHFMYDQRNTSCYYVVYLESGFIRSVIRIVCQLLYRNDLILYPLIFTLNAWANGTAFSSIISLS